MPVGITPIYKIVKDGADITDRFNDRTTLIKIELSTEGDENDTFECSIDDRDWALEIPPNQGKLDVYLGYKEVGLAYMGRFEAGDVFMEGPPRTMRLVCKAAGMKSLMKSPIVKEFDNKTIEDVFKESGEKSGMSVSVSPQFAGITLPYLNQTQSPYHLMGEIARRVGGAWKIEDGKILLVPRDEGNAVSGESMSTLVIRPEHLNQWSVQISDRNQFTHVEAPWFDKDKWERKYEKTDLFPNLEEVGTYIMNRVFNSQKEAELAAKSKANALRRGTVKGSFRLAKGDPWIRAQMPLLIENMRDGIDGSYVIEKVVHTYRKEDGIMTEITGNTPGGGADFSDQAEDGKYEGLPEPREVPQVGQGPRGDL